MNVLYINFLTWWVDGVFSKGRTLINFNSEKDNKRFYKIYDILEKKVADMEKDNDLICNDFFNAVVSLRDLFYPNEFGKVNLLESALREFAGSGKAEFSILENTTSFTYSQNHAKYNFSRIPKEYRGFIEELSQVMVEDN